MSKAKEFAKSSGIYFTGKVLTLLITIILLPLYTNYISTTDYGNYELVRSFADLAIPFLCAECWKAIFRLAFTKKYKDNKEKLFATSFYFCLISDFIIGVTLFFVFKSLDINPLFPIILIFSETINFLFQYIARSLEKNLIFSLSGILGSASNAIVGLLCIFVFKNFRDAMFIALISSHIVQTTIIFISVRGWKLLNIKYASFNCFKDVIKFAWPFGLTTLVYYFSNGFNPLLIKTFLESGIEKVAIYTVALKFIAVVTLFASVIEMAWADILYKIADEEERREYINKWLKIAFKFFMISGLLLLFVVKFIFPILIGEDYQSAWKLLPILYVSSFFIMTNNTLLNPCRAQNKPWIFLVAKAVNGVVSVSLFFILYKTYDLTAICVAHSAGLIAEFIAFQILDHFVLKLDFQILSPVIFVVVYALLAYFIFNYSLSFNAMIFILLAIFSFFFVRKDLNEITSSKYKVFNTKIKINKNILIYSLSLSVLYQCVLWISTFLMIDESKLLFFIVGIVLVSIVLVYFIGKYFHLEYKTKTLVCFTSMFLNVFVYGLAFIILTEFIEIKALTSPLFVIVFILLMLNISFSDALLRYRND